MPFENRLHARCGCASAHGALSARPFAFPGTTRKFERSRPFAIRHLALDLVLDIDKKEVRGSATLDIERIDEAETELTLDALSFRLKDVSLDAGSGFRPVKHVYDGDTISVRIPESVARAKVRVEYSVRPKKGLYFLAPDEHVQDRPTQVWSQCQDEDARAWIPCHDKPHLKQTTELRVTVPKGWFALSNGSLLERAEHAGGDVFHWKMDRPHASYLITLVAGEFAHLDDRTVGAVPVTYLVPKGREDDGRRTFSRTPDMIEHFAKVTGTPFPWEKYAQVVVSDFVFGGMENTTATTMYEHILLDARAELDISSDDLIAHELAHQWFGDYVTCRDWSHGWLNEGFATYFEHVDRERRLGADEYDYGVKQDQDAYLAEAGARYQRPIVCQDYEAPIDLFDRHLYEKGGLVLHMLRRELGDDIFWKGVAEYLRRHAYSVVETRDLLRALEDVSGKSLERFFEQWVMKAGHPVLDVRLSFDDGVLLVEAKQTQKTSAEVSLFALVLEVDIVGEDGTTRREVLSLERAAEVHAIPVAERPRFVVVDPRHRVVGEVSVDAPNDMLRHQLLEASTARGRWLAAGPLGKRDDIDTRDALAKVLADESAFWGLRAEAAYALAHIKSPEAMATLVASTGVVHPKARRAVVWALGRFPRAAAATALLPMVLRDASYVVEAEAARSLGATRQPSAFDALVEVIDRPSWADVVRAGAIDGLASLRDERAVPHLAARTRYGISSRGRRAAVRALPRIATDRKTRELLEDLLEDPDPHLRIDVGIALGDLGDVKSRPALARATERDPDGRVRRRLREISRDLTGGAKAEQQRLTDELEKVRTDHQELKTRLAKLEAKLTAPKPAVARTAPTARPAKKTKSTAKPKRR